MRELYLLS